MVQNAHLVTNINQQLMECIPVGGIWWNAMSLELNKRWSITNMIGTVVTDKHRYIGISVAINLKPTNNFRILVSTNICSICHRVAEIIMFNYGLRTFDLPVGWHMARYQLYSVLGRWYYSIGGLFRSLCLSYAALFTEAKRCKIGQFCV